MEGVRNNSRRRKSSFVPMLLGFLIGICIGSLAYSSMSAVLNERREGGVAAPKNGNSDQSLYGSQLGTTELQDLHALYDVNSKSQLVAALYAEIDGTSRDKLIGLIEQSVNLGHSALAFETQEILLAELARSEPELALEKTWTFAASRWSELISVVFDEWAVRSPRNALAHASDLIGALHESAMHAILDEMEEISGEQLADVGQAGGIKAIVEQRIAEDKAMELMASPSQAWDQVVHDDISDDIQEELLFKIADRWLKKGDLELLDRVYHDSPLDRFSASYPLQKRIEALVLELDPQGAWEFVLSMPIEKQRDAAASLLGTIARDDPEGAFASTFQLPTSFNRRMAQWAVLHEWAEQSPQELLDKVLDFPQEMRQDIVMRALGPIARESPEQAAEQLKLMELVLGDVDEQAAFTVVLEWVEIDPIAASKWAKESYDAESRVRARLMQRVVYALAKTDYEEALNVALAEKPHSWNFGSGLEIYVVESLVDQGEIGRAIEMLDRIRDSSLRTSLYHVGTALIESRRSKEAVELANRLPEKNQVGYLQGLVYTWLTSNPVDLVEKMPTLPTERARSEAAKRALSMKDSSFVTLTDAQVAELQGYVIEEDSSGETN